jgi:hypothetical protein
MMYIVYATILDLNCSIKMKMVANWSGCKPLYVLTICLHFDRWIGMEQFKIFAWNCMLQKKPIYIIIIFNNLKHLPKMGNLNVPLPWGYNLFNMDEQQPFLCKSLPFFIKVWRFFCLLLILSQFFFLFLDLDFVTKIFSTTSCIFIKKIIGSFS